MGENTIIYRQEEISQMSLINENLKSFKIFLSESIMICEQ
jgi:hypothetical protein